MAYGKNNGKHRLGTAKKFVAKQKDKTKLKEKDYKAKAKKKIGL